ncbi:bifunctional UDP-N-acetylglucosamine diphosphorylase/glucosamine-1-phosphate N-acetyltransferase GlmU [Herbiconiux sp. KACC 21604]|uniref:bifunctional UDP-N-acetylglucosamine diphosphorylase/glucosamine-1-phosphate N-acetyltransferase GlmU n=1 Tax=unclassified Herbiconiux TaxID=2618217 RepID=UPI0014924AB5|nr:bifunctional UDP-N-acetylglucosamine diphosphorylase/glucosamine-1-phosphate N-acetyltransferase GlmU [Herbiconiux sp. SALV-R1]QJU52838.1 bifunctional UDP-N-acetylglucosamine diphosphorylase/glucosamine-1-phosphate N-acetyltransferase GlmU [Herbiconiux sp. SALV-R1]WPO87754.1 bifunctional UDP-N-acetylglucosamine diphosphorylase/glucosamine-1-phosphate N-acetyltransferase GlmU [Herbiconiux sp. KACC 21604]
MTDPHLAIVVLAAGQGTRMKSQTPKLLHEIAGVPLIGHVLATAGEMDAAYTVSVVRHERDRVVEVIEDHFPSSIIADQDEVAGTGRAVEQAIAALPADFEGDVLVVSGDVPLLDADTLRGLVAEHRASAASATLLSAVLDDATGYGRIVRGDGGLLDRIVEHKDANDSELAIREINAGVYVFGLAELRDQLAQVSTDNAQGEKYLTDVIGLLRRAGSDVAAVPVSEPWLVAGINDRAQLSEAAAKLNALIVRGWQLNGVTVVDPATTWIDLKASFETDVTLLPGTQIKGATSIARGAVVGPDTTLVDCEVGEGAEVKRTDATLSVIGAGASVGPFAFLRPNTVLDADGKIGTFVETKNSHIGAGSKVPHLSYIGDTEVGVGSNVGAGTITANYDGVNKHRTRVGSHVRTGSHNVFVAPVRIGDGAYTGAGTVVRKDVPAGSLAINVAPQRNLAGWVEQNRPGTDAATAAAEAQSAEQIGE